MPKSAASSPTSPVNEAIALWLLTNAFGSTLSWTAMYAWWPFSWGDEEMLAPVLIVFLIGIQSLVIIPIAGYFFNKALAFNKVPTRLLAVAMLCVGLWLAACCGLLLYKNIIHWKALTLSACAYLAALLLASAVVYRRWLIYSDETSTPLVGK
ncbi:hypothetical protein ACVWYF_001995 [Hymenobacter sp. UYAg731]